MTRPDCIFLDVFLSDISGVEVAKKMAETFTETNEEGIQVIPPPIIYVSANSLEEVRELDPELPIDHYLRKPFNSAKLAEVLDLVFPDEA